jgi:hypothetical protein
VLIRSNKQIPLLRPGLFSNFVFVVGLLGARLVSLAELRGLGALMQVGLHVIVLVNVGFFPLGGKLVGRANREVLHRLGNVLALLAHRRSAVSAEEGVRVGEQTGLTGGVGFAEQFEWVLNCLFTLHI